MDHREQTVHRFAGKELAGAVIYITITVQPYLGMTTPVDFVWGNRFKPPSSRGVMIEPCFASSRR